MMIRTLALALACLAGLAGPTMAQVAQRKALTLEGAKQIAAAAEVEALKNKWNVAIAIVDEAGYLLYFQRMDGVQLGSVEVAMQKARTSALFKRPSKAFEDTVAGGRIVVLKLEGAVPLEGGLPIEVDGQIVGAIGVSGVTSQQDAQIGKAGIDAFLKNLPR